MSSHQGAGVVLKYRAVCGETDCAGRAFDQPFSERRFEPLEFHADASLCRAEHFGGAGEALQLGYQQEGLNGRNIQRGHFVIMNRYD